MSKMTKKAGSSRYFDKDIRKYSDEDISRYIKEGMQGLNLSAARKHVLRQEVCFEAARCRDGIARRILRRVNVFMETTFEISLAPVVTALGVLMVGVTALGYGYFMLPSETHPGNPAGYIQQTSINPDGSTRIMFIPADRRG